MYSLSCTTAPYWAWKYLSFWQDRNKNSCTWKSSVQFSPQPPSVELRYLWWSTITQYYKYVCTSLPLPVFPDLWNTNIPFHRVFYCCVVGIGVQLLLISATAVHLLTVLVHSWSVQYHLETSEEGRGRGRSSVGGWKSNSSVPLMICFYLDWASGTFVLESIFGNGFCKDDVGRKQNRSCCRFLSFFTHYRNTNIQRLVPSMVVLLGVYYTQYCSISVLQSFPGPSQLSDYNCA